MPRKIICMITLTATLAISGASAFGQAAQRTSATYDDWTVACDLVTDGSNRCELTSTQRIQGQPEPVGQIAISRQNKKDPLKLYVVTPPNASVRTGIKLLFDEKASAIAVTFRWCTNLRCLADTELNPEMIKNIRALSGSGKMEYKDATERDTSVPVSFKGLKQAWDYMEKQ